MPNVRALPSAEIDISAPEKLGVGAVEICDFLGGPARVYSLHRIAGEKLRAYLTSLPEYRQKMDGGERNFRVKDLYDIARIVKARPLTDLRFWQLANVEFRLACQSRCVDCRGPEMFKQFWNLARDRYESDLTLGSIPFSDAEEALGLVLEAFVNFGSFPLEFPLTDDSIVK